MGNIRLFGAQPFTPDTVSILEYGLMKGLLQFDEYPDVKSQDTIHVEVSNSFDYARLQLIFKLNEEIVDVYECRQVDDGKIRLCPQWENASERDIPTDEPLDLQLEVHFCEGVNCVDDLEVKAAAVNAGLMLMVPK